MLNILTYMAFKYDYLYPCHSGKSPVIMKVQQRYEILLFDAGSRLLCGDLINGNI